MRTVLTLGAFGEIAQIVTNELIQQPDIKQKLFLRNAHRLQILNSEKIQVIEGDATNETQLEIAMNGVDFVYANLSGNNIAKQALAVVKAMEQTRLNRLIWISAIGVYGEIEGKFGEWTRAALPGGYLESYSEAVTIVEDSNLDYTIIRPTWLSDKDEIEYILLDRNKPVKETEVSRKSIADFVAKLIKNPTVYLRTSLAVVKPNVFGDKPSFY